MLGGASDNKPLFRESVVTFSNHLKQLREVDTLFNKLSHMASSSLSGVVETQLQGKTVMISKKIEQAAVIVGFRKPDRRYPLLDSIC